MVKPTSAFTSPWYPSFCVGSVGLCFVRHCWSDSGCVGLTMCVFDDPKSSKHFSRIKLHEPDAGISQWSQPQKLELCGAASEADYRLVLSSSRFLNSEGKICWVTSSAFIHAQWQASFLALFRNLKALKGRSRFQRFEAQRSIPGATTHWPLLVRTLLWALHRHRSLATQQPPQHLGPSCSWPVLIIFSNSETLMNVLKMSNLCHVWKFWSRLFLPSVSSKSTLETTPVLRSLSTAACNKVSTDENWYYLVNHTKVEACNVGSTLTRSSWSTRLKMKRCHETPSEIWEMRTMPWNETICICMYIVYIYMMRKAEAWTRWNHVVCQLGDPHEQYFVVGYSQRTRATTASLLFAFLAIIFVNRMLCKDCFLQIWCQISPCTALQQFHIWAKLQSMSRYFGIARS